MLKKIQTYDLYLTAIWLVCILLINPLGDFPLNDDWSYALNARALTLENKIEFNDWGAMTLIAHSFWGAFFCKIFGYSFTVLRASTLVLGWGAMMVSFRFFQEGGMQKQYAFWATLLLVFNTFFFVNAFSYMTEVPFICFFISSAYFSLKVINDKGQHNIIFATVFSMIAVLIRQHGVLVPVAFFFTYIIKNKFSLKPVIQSLIPVIFTFGTLFLFIHWREATFGLSKNFGHLSDLIVNFYNGKFAFAVSRKANGYFAFWALFSVPILILLINSFLKKRDLVIKMIASIFTALICYPYYKVYNRELIGNTFNNLHIGPVTIPNQSGLVPPEVSTMDWDNFKLFLFIASILLVFWILVRTMQLFIFLKTHYSKGDSKSFYELDQNEVNWSSLFALGASFGYFSFLMINHYFFDRYTLVIFPFLILLIVPTKINFSFPKILQAISLFSFMIIAGYSFMVTRDYLSWNRAKWEAINYSLETLNIQPEEIHGGIEHRGYFGIPHDHPIEWQYLNEWNSHQQKYTVALSPICKYQTIQTFPYTRLMPLRTDSIYLLKRESLSRIDTITSNLEILDSTNNHFITNQKTIFLQNSNSLNPEHTHSGKNAVMLNHQQEYALTVTLENVEPCEKIYISTWKYPFTHTARGVVAGSNIYLNDIFEVIKNKENNWAKVNQEFSVPEDFEGGSLSFYLYNPLEEKVWFDDLTLIRIK